MVASTVHVDVKEDTTVYSRQQQRPSSLSISSKRFFVALLALTTLFILNEFYHLSSDQPTTQQLSTTDQHIAIGFSSKVTLQHLLDTPDQQTEHQQQQEPLLRPQKDRRKKARVFDTYVAGNHDVPDYVNTSREKLQYLLDIHDKPNGGFLDVDPNDPFA